MCDYQIYGLLTLWFMLQAFLLLLLVTQSALVMFLAQICAFLVDLSVPVCSAAFVRGEPDSV